MRAKKSLGQHFLRSERALRAIIEAGDPNPGDIVLEIGPGEGVLTRLLVNMAGKVVAVEKDDALFEELKQKFASEIEEGRLDLIHGDILAFDPSTLKFYKNFTYKLIANIPYNITGAILEKFLSAKYQPELMVLLVQDEVAKRIISLPRHRVSGKAGTAVNKESILSISVKVYSEPRYVDRVLAGSFVPAPKVNSAIISIESISKDFFSQIDEKAFFELLQAGFQSKRKKLSSNLAKIFPKERVQEAFSALQIDENTRAEDLSLENWQKLALKLVAQ